MRDVPLALYRFACPRCARVLKAPRRLAGKEGACPACEEALTFPAVRLAVGSWTVRQVAGVVCGGEGAGDRKVEEETLDRVGLLLAQGTCLEYTMAREQLPGRMAARQWRKLLVLAESRELIRLEIQRAMEGNARAGGFEEHARVAAGQAWTVMARYLHFDRHGMCRQCAKDKTGMGCIYQSFGRFAEAARWEAERGWKWQTAFEQVLGLRVAAG